MVMNEAEICRSYREAKKPKQQIAILADLNMCSRKEIVCVLRAAGVEVEAPKEKKEDFRKNIERPEAEKELPDAVKEAIFLRLDELETQIRIREREYQALVAYLGITPGKGLADELLDAVIEDRR